MGTANLDKSSQVPSEHDYSANRSLSELAVSYSVRKPVRGFVFLTFSSRRSRGESAKVLRDPIHAKQTHACCRHSKNKQKPRCYMGFSKAESPLTFAKTRRCAPLWWSNGGQSFAPKIRNNSSGTTAPQRRFTGKLSEYTPSLSVRKPKKSRIADIQTTAASDGNMISKSMANVGSKNRIEMMHSSRFSEAN